jgi:hypothetical protein
MINDGQKKINDHVSRRPLRIGAEICLLIRFWTRFYGMSSLLLLLPEALKAKT